MRKEKAERVWTIEDSLKENEKFIREEARKILNYKENGGNQKTINKMIAILAISKKSYDDLKRRYEAYGK